jgi:hypothetical protein
MLKKNKRIPIIVGGLASIALLSVGFANWVVGTQVTNKVVSDNVLMQVAGVNDNRLKAVIMSDPAIDSDVKFDAVGTTGVGSIKPSSDAPSKENMDFSATIRVGLTKMNDDGTYGTGDAAYKVGTDANVSNLFNKVNFTFAVVSTVEGDPTYSEKLTAYNTSISDGVILAPESVETPTTGFEDVFHDTTDKQYIKQHITFAADHDHGYVDVSFKFGFGWGATPFNYKNPVNYNGIGTDLDSAITKLQTLSKANGVKFSLKFSTDLTA